MEQKAKSILAIYLLIDGKAAPVPMSGLYSLEDKKLSFVPYNELSGGQQFIAYYYTDKDTFQQHIAIPTSNIEKPLAEVVEIYPKTSHIPRNILFFHVRFSQSMREDIEAFQYIKVLDSKGAEIPKVWRERSYWLDDRKLLVLMVHPGKVKRGISAKIPFKKGQAYSIYVDPTIEDRYSRPITAAFKKQYHTVAEDYQVPKILFPQFELPQVETKKPLVMAFSESMNHASIIDGVTIVNKNTNSTIKGQFSCNETDSSYVFIPQEAWKATEYEVVFNYKVSDLANNRLHRLFEIKKLDEKAKDDKPVKWKFSPTKK